MLKHFHRALTRRITSTSFQSISNTTPAYTTYTYKKIGNFKLDADVYLPSTSPYSKPPVMFYIHGGRFVSGTKLDSLETLQRDEILSRGWSIVSINYRLAPNSYIGDMVRDVQDAYRWVRDDLARKVPINSDATTLFGASAGAYLATIGGYVLEPRPKAILGLYPIFLSHTNSSLYNPNTPVSGELVRKAENLRQLASEASFTGSEDPRFDLFMTALKERKVSWLTTTANPNEAPSKILAELQKYSTVDNIDENYPPTCLVHGMRDGIAPPHLSVDLIKGLEEKKVPNKLILDPSFEHEFDLKMKKTEQWPQIWKDYMLPMFDFADLHTNKKRGSYNGSSLSGSQAIFNP